MSWFSSADNWLDNVVGNTAGQLGNYFSGSTAGNISYNRSAALADYNAQISKSLAEWNATELPSMTVKGLERAGLNPILAVNNGGGALTSAKGASASGGNVSVQSKEIPLVGFLSNLLGFSKLGAESAQMLASAKLTNAQATEQELKNKALTPEIMSDKAIKESRGPVGNTLRDFEQLPSRLLRDNQPLGFLWHKAKSGLESLGNSIGDSSFGRKAVEALDALQNTNNPHSARQTADKVDKFTEFAKDLNKLYQNRRYQHESGSRPSVKHTRRHY